MSACCLVLFFLSLSVAVCSGHQYWKLLDNRPQEMKLADLQGQFGYHPEAAAATTGEAPAVGSGKRSGKGKAENSDRNRIQSRL